MQKFPTSFLDAPKVFCPPQIPSGPSYDCKFMLNIGVFFDGTHNNVYEDKNKNGRVDGQSNVARLSELYRDEPDQGYFRHYIQGVGTPFPEIGEKAESTFGSAFAAGGEARIIWGLLQVLNSMHSFVNNGALMFEVDEMALLASSRPDSIRDFATKDNELFDQIRQKTGTRLRFGLNGNWQNTRHTFLMHCYGKLSMQLNDKRTVPGITGVYLDVFGFSRGAAQARVFCNWLHQSLLLDGKLCGVPAYVRFLGLFDTVSSVGWNQTGHVSWASAADLRIHPDIKNCLHYVALHEFRNNFPLDSVCVNGDLPDNCCEQIAPGAHSDVGGGYEPGEQGKGVCLVTPDPYYPDDKRAQKDNSYKLSQLTLNRMLEAAKKARENHPADNGAPWLDLNTKNPRKLQDLTDRQLISQFACHPSVLNMVDGYFKKCDIAPCAVELALQKHVKLYLGWRYLVNQSKEGFNDLDSLRWAQRTDTKVRVGYYLDGQKIFAAQIKTRGVGGGYHSKAQEIYEEIKSTEPSWFMNKFFDGYVHDSYAGFISQFKDGLVGQLTGAAAHIIAEPRRYLSYRYMYSGDETRLNTMADQNQRLA